MRIECPACAAAYEVPEGLLVAGQTVECARCGGEWTPLPLPPPKPPSPPVSEVTTPPATDWFASIDRGWSPPPPPRVPLVPLAWIGSIVVLAVLLALSFIARDSLMAKWPPSSRLFSALGLDDR